MGNRENQRKIAERTLAAIERGYFLLDDSRYDIAVPVQAAKDGTRFYAPDSSLSEWAHPPVVPAPSPTPMRVSVLEISTIEGARLLARVAEDADDSQTMLPEYTAQPPAPRRIGVLNFASATKPGGGFLSGASAQEESLARSSTLYPTLMTPAGRQFYATHKALVPKTGFYTHSMIFSPGVLLFRDDSGGWIVPVPVDVLTVAAVNAGVVRGAAFFGKHTKGGVVPDPKKEARIAAAMRGRMARALYLFERQGVRELVLGSFGTGVFQNSVDTVARIWADLLVVPGARFGNSFDRVVFAVLGRATFDAFEAGFEKERQGER